MTRLLTVGAGGITVGDAGRAFGSEVQIERAGSCAWVPSILPPKEVRHEARELVGCIFPESALRRSCVGPDRGGHGSDRYDIAPVDHARSLSGYRGVGADTPSDD